MAHHEKKLDKAKEKAAKVEPIKPGDKRAGKKKGLLDTCQWYGPKALFFIPADTRFYEPDQIILIQTVNRKL